MLKLGNVNNTCMCKRDYLYCLQSTDGEPASQEVHVAYREKLTSEVCAAVQRMERLQLLSTSWPISTKQLQENKLPQPAQSGPVSADWGRGQQIGGLPPLSVVPSSPHAEQVEELLKWSL